MRTSELTHDRRRCFGVVGFVDAVVAMSGDELMGMVVEVEVVVVVEDEVVGVDLSVADLERYASMFGGFFFLRTGIVYACECVLVGAMPLKKK